MDTGKLKKFATEARTNLMDGVRLKLRRLGFDEHGHTMKTPELISGGTIWNGEEYPEEFYAQWTALRDMLLKRGIREVVETAAYIWFNRMVAIRILAKNNLCDAILSNDETTGMPRLLAEARMGRVPEMTVQQHRRFEWLMNDDNRTADQFSVLLTSWCHANPIINSCFGSIDDFVEILLPDNILKDNGFLALLNHTEFITDEDFKSAELIGWLYQFYISDRKDEVFAKKGKVEAEEIPAATQIFTPNWIVKYMVQNTIIPQVDAPEEVVAECKYLVKTDGSDSRKIELEDLKVADFACGSGHILNECFDLLYDLYKAEAYSRREAIESVFTKNLLGIDIDLRAKQLATFALLLKACQRDASFTDAHCMPRVLTVPGLTAILKTSKYEDENGGHGKHIKHIFFQDSVTDAVAKEMEDALTLLKDTDSLGSIIKFNLSASALRAIKETTEYWQSKDPANRPEFVNDVLPAIDFIMALTDSYDAIVMNPPYMPTSRVDVLKDYAIKNYPDSKADLFSVFMDVCIDRLKDEGKYGMINMQSWMFLSSFEALRKKIIEEQHIDSLLHLGPRTFDELSGEVVQNAAFVIAKEKPESEDIYYRLIDGNSCSAKHEMFLSGENRYVVADQKLFELIPGAPIAYWLSRNLVDKFLGMKLGDISLSRSGFSTGNNDKYIRVWHEVSFKQISLDSESLQEYINSGCRYIPFTAGGSFRRWYGNLYNVVDWTDTAAMHRPRTTYSDLYCKAALTWNEVTSDTFSSRYYPQGLLFEHSGVSMFVEERVSRDYVLGLLNSKILPTYLSALNPTLHNGAEVVAKVPFVESQDNSINTTVRESVSISKQDWDTHETSWDFEGSPLLAIQKQRRGLIVDVTFSDDFEFIPGVHGIFDDTKILHCVNAYKKAWEYLFNKLHSNEEELNCRFIEIYGLQDELTPEIPLNEVTILQQGEIEIEDSNDSRFEDTKNFVDGFITSRGKTKRIKWHEDIIIKQLISYIVGVWMGRYRLDKPGLHIAHPNPSDDEIIKYQIPNTNYELQIDVDGIIPVLPADAPFFDNLRNYVVEFVRKVWGDDSLTENINFMEKCLGKSLDDFLMKDFWKYHKKMYQNRPIYWEFASKKGAFRALIYAHRMDRYTVEVLRSKYLLPYIGHIERKIAALELRQNELTTSERRELDNLRNKTLPELREYHDRVEKVAAETASRSTVFDLDDGIPHNHALFGDIVTKLK